MVSSNEWQKLKERIKKSMAKSKSDEDMAQDYVRWKKEQEQKIQEQKRTKVARKKK